MTAEGHPARRAPTSTATARPGARDAFPVIPLRAQQPNHLLRRARLGRLSPSGSGRPMSRQELAEALNAHLFTETGRAANLDENYIGKLERGQIRWPSAGYRHALRAVLSAATDPDLGFYIVRRSASTTEAAGWPLAPRGPTPERADRVGVPAAAPSREAVSVRLVVTPGASLTLVAEHTRVLVEALLEHPDTGPGSLDSQTILLARASGADDDLLQLPAGARVYSLEHQRQR